jgi:solute carrier family 25 (mitochondrial carnitine/acylcarnitine transporter), member 20/29
VENLVKTQMQLDNITNKRYSGSMHCITQLVKEHGVAIIYKGHVINTIREATFLGNYFFTYEAMREYFITHNIFGSAGEGVKIAVPVAGGLAGAWSWFASFPLDCVRAGVQGQDLNSNRRHGAVEIFSNLIRDRGFRGLYSGASASIARAFLVSGSRFSAYEFALWLLRGGRNYERHH